MRNMKISRTQVVFQFIEFTIINISHELYKLEQQGLYEMYIDNIIEYCYKTKTINNGNVEKEFLLNSSQDERCVICGTVRQILTEKGFYVRHVPESDNSATIKG